MQLIVIGILVVCIVVMLAFKRKKRSEQELEDSQAALEDLRKNSAGRVKPEENTSKLEGEPRKLNTLDAPMILSRIEKLELVKQLEQSKQERLKRKVLDLCKKEAEGMWWEPLEHFAKTLRTKEDQIVFMLNAKNININTIAQVNDTFGFLMRHSEITFSQITLDGEELDIDPRDLLEDGIYQMNVRRRDRAIPFTIEIEEERFVVQKWIHEINLILGRLKVPYRLLTLVPKGDLWCIVYVPKLPADRAVQNNWARM